MFFKIPSSVSLGYSCMHICSCNSCLGIFKPSKIPDYSGFEY